MSDFLLRTEDIRPDEILKYYVETRKDASIVESLKEKSPVLLEGSRGVGKSFLLRVAEQQLTNNIDQERILPVYVPLSKAILLNTSNDQQFRYWTLAKLSSRLVRKLRKNGLTVDIGREVSILGGSESSSDPVNDTIREFEESYRNPGREVDTEEVPGAEQFKLAVEDICEILDLKRIVVLFDEAAHVLQPKHQRQFFTLFRDLRTPYISCNAAVYPGITSFGDTFERLHDAKTEKVERDVLDSNYINDMTEIVTAQADSHTLRRVEEKKDSFRVLAYAASGNPRFLLKMLSENSDLNDVVNTIKNYFRHDIWYEHNRLVDRFEGLEKLVNWGESFVRDYILPKIHSKNENNGNTTRYFWIQDDAPRSVYKSIQLLMYTGIVSVDKESYVGTNDWTGRRYGVNLGIIFSHKSYPKKKCLRLSESLSPSNPVLFNNEHSAFSEIKGADIIVDGQSSEILQEMLVNPVEDLDLTDFKIKRIKEQGLDTIGDVLDSSEQLLKKGYYIGDIRARKMHNAAQAAVMEYLMG